MGSTPLTRRLQLSPGKGHRTGEGWLYLCAVLDLYSGKVIGWSMAPAQDRRLVVKAVMMASRHRSDRSAVILHSDRVTQSTSVEYQQFLADHHIVSMSDVDHCGDNAAAEGFFGRLKRERVHRRRYLTLAEARTDVFDYIERFHNRSSSAGSMPGIRPLDSYGNSRENGVEPRRRLQVRRIR